MNFKVALLTEASANLKDWGNVEWFGIEEMYMPYYCVDDWALAHAYADKNGNFEMEVSESFPFLAAYRHGEYLCTLELPFVCYTGQVITVKNFKMKVPT